MSVRRGSSLIADVVPEVEAERGRLLLNPQRPLSPQMRRRVPTMLSLLLAVGCFRRALFCSTPLLHAPISRTRNIYYNVT